MNHTTNYNLKKPLQSEYYNVDDFNDNADIIDAALKSHSDKIGNLANLETEENSSLVGAINEVWNYVVEVDHNLPNVENGSLQIGNLLFQWGKLTANHTDASQTAAFTTEYDEIPHIQLTCARYADMFAISSVSKTLLTLDASTYVAATGVSTSVDIYWLAIGPIATTTTTTTE